MNEASPTDPTTFDRQDTEDMERLSAGHDAALNALMDRHGERLFHYLVRCLQNEEDAADLAQEAFVRVYQNRAKFDAGQKFSTWLYAMAANLVKDRYRWRSRHPQVSLEAESDPSGSSLREHLSAPDPSPSDHLHAAERAREVRRAVAALPEELRLSLILAEYEERSHAEIAEILGCTAKAVETRIYRARQQLRLALSALLSES